MVIFRCYAELPAFDPMSDDPWVNRALYSAAGAVEQLRTGKLPFTDNCRRVLKELGDADYDAELHSFTDADGVYVPDRFVATALAVVAAVEQYGEELVFTAAPPLDRPRVLHALHALPLTFRFAVTFKQYYYIVTEIDHVCSVQDKFITYGPDGEEQIDDPDAYEDAYAAELAEYDFTVEANGEIIHLSQPTFERDGNKVSLCTLGADYVRLRWDHNLAAIYKMLLARRDTLPAPLEPVTEKPIPGLGGVLGVPVTGRLLFDPNNRLAIDPNNRLLFNRPGHRRIHYGMLTIVCCGGKIWTEDHVGAGKCDLLTICANALFHARAAEGGVSVSLVTDTAISTVKDYSVLDGVLFCITAAADGIVVSDYREALQDFADAIEKYFL